MVHGSIPPTRFSPRHWLAIFTLAALLPLAGCSSLNSMMGGNSEQEAKAEINWDFTADAIQIEIATDDELNRHLNRAHTLVLGIFQLRDEQTFLKMLDNAEALKGILINGDTEQVGDGLTGSERYVLSPGKNALITMDRLQNTQFIGIVAGYYNFEPLAAARLFRIPLNVSRSGLISKTYTASPAQLALRLQLGPARIENAQNLTFDAEKKPAMQVIPPDPLRAEIPLSGDALETARSRADAARKLGR